MASSHEKSVNQRKGCCKKGHLKHSKQYTQILSQLFELGAFGKGEIERCWWWDHSSWRNGDAVSSQSVLPYLTTSVPPFSQVDPTLVLQYVWQQCKFMFFSIDIAQHFCCFYKRRDRVDLKESCS